MTISPQEVSLTVGLDLGSTSIKVVALGSRRRGERYATLYKGGGPRPIVGRSLVPVSAGEDADRSGAIRAAVEALGFPVQTVNVAVSGQWVLIRVLEMPIMSPAEVRQALPFEAQRYLPFNVQDVILDGAILGPAEAKKIWVLIVACKKELVERRIDWARRAGLGIALIDVEALALANGLLADGNGHAKQGTRAVMNVGAQLTNVVVFQNDIPYLVRDVPWGAERLTRQAAEQVGGRAEDIQAALLEGRLSPEMRGALTVATEALVSELQLSFDYFENRFGQPPETMLVSGGLSQSADFIEALRSHLTQTVMPWTPASELSGQFAVAYGLALRTC